MHKNSNPDNYWVDDAGRAHTEPEPGLESDSSSDIRDVYVTGTWAFEREVARLNKKAVRIGVQPIQLTNLGKVTKTRTIVIGGDGEEADVKHVPVEVTHYQVVLPAPADRTWETIAKITPVDGQAFVEPMQPGVDVTPWKAADPQHCDHCNTRRARSLCYVVRNTVTGKVMQLGRNCFEDYVGKDTLAALEFRSVVEVNLGGDDEGFFPRGMGQTEVVETRACVAAAEALASIDGWHRNEKTEDGYWKVEGTHRVAKACLIDVCLTGRNPHTREAIQLAKSVRDDQTHPIWARADALIERLQGLEATDEFSAALKNVADYTHIPSQKASLAAYIGQYLRQLDDRAQREARKATMKHVGSVGQRATFGPLTVKACPSIETDYGTMYINIFEDADGNALVWKTGSRSYAIGDVVTLKGTVKEHGERQGVPQTILSRCKAIEAKFVDPQPMPRAEAYGAAEIKQALEDARQFEADNKANDEACERLGLR